MMCISEIIKHNSNRQNIICVKKRCCDFLNYVISRGGGRGFSGHLTEERKQPHRPQALRVFRHGEVRHGECKHVPRHETKVALPGYIISRHLSYENVC